MSDYIKREDAINAIFSNAFTPSVVRRVLRQIPSADVVERKRGEWELHNVIFDILKCTSCGSTINCNAFGEYYKKHWKFCPNCGAEMENRDG